MLPAVPGSSSNPPSVARAAAADAAVRLIEPGMTIGLGSGRAVWQVVEGVGRRWPGGPPIRAVVASERTDELARAAGIELVDLDGELRLDLAIDGTDELDAELRLLKGGGGALLREKIVIAAARRFEVVAEASKRVERLGERFPLPVEVVRFGWRETRRRLLELLPDARLRPAEDGAGPEEPYLTDEGHYLLDCSLPPKEDLAELDARVKAVPGVVEHGLFLGLASRALLGRPDGAVDVLEAGSV
jgi:ribose 5-phosphate isomerase A